MQTVTINIKWPQILAFLIWLLSIYYLPNFFPNLTYRTNIFILVGVYAFLSLLVSCAYFFKTAKINILFSTVFCLGTISLINLLLFYGLHKLILSAANLIQFNIAQAAAIFTGLSLCLKLSLKFQIASKELSLEMDKADEVLRTHHSQSKISRQKMNALDEKTTSETQSVQEDISNKEPKSDPKTAEINNENTNPIKKHLKSSKSTGEKSDHEDKSIFREENLLSIIDRLDKTDKKARISGNYKQVKIKDVLNNIDATTKTLETSKINKTDVTKNLDPNKINKIETSTSNFSSTKPALKKTNKIKLPSKSGKPLEASPKESIRAKMTQLEQSEIAETRVVNQKSSKPVNTTQNSLKSLSDVNDLDSLLTSIDLISITAVNQSKNNQPEPLEEAPVHAKSVDNLNDFSSMDQTENVINDSVGADITIEKDLPLSQAENVINDSVGADITIEKDLPLSQSDTISPDVVIVDGEMVENSLNVSIQTNSNVQTSKKVFNNIDDIINPNDIENMVKQLITDDFVVNTKSKKSNIVDNKPIKDDNYNDFLEARRQMSKLKATASFNRPVIDQSIDNRSTEPKAKLNQSESLEINQAEAKIDLNKIEQALKNNDLGETINSQQLAAFNIGNENIEAKDASKPNIEVDMAEENFKAKDSIEPNIEVNIGNENIEAKDSIEPNIEVNIGNENTILDSPEIIKESKLEDNSLENNNQNRPETFENSNNIVNQPMPNVQTVDVHDALDIDVNELIASLEQAQSQILQPDTQEDITSSLNSKSNELNFNPESIDDPILKSMEGINLQNESLEKIKSSIKFEDLPDVNPNKPAPLGLDPKLNPKSKQSAMSSKVKSYFSKSKKGSDNVKDTHSTLEAVTDNAENLATKIQSDNKTTNISISKPGAIIKDESKNETDWDKSVDDAFAKLVPASAMQEYNSGIQNIDTTISNGETDNFKDSVKAQLDSSEAIIRHNFNDLHPDNTNQESIGEYVTLELKEPTLNVSTEINDAVNEAFDKLIPKSALKTYSSNEEPSSSILLEQTEPELELNNEAMSESRMAPTIAQPVHTPTETIAKEEIVAQKKSPSSENDITLQVDPDTENALNALMNDVLNATAVNSPNVSSVTADLKNNNELAESTTNIKPDKFSDTLQNLPSLENPYENLLGNINPSTLNKNEILKQLKNNLPVINDKNDNEKPLNKFVPITPLVSNKEFVRLTGNEAIAKAAPNINAQKSLGQLAQDIETMDNIIAQSHDVAKNIIEAENKRQAKSKDSNTLVTKKVLSQARGEGLDEILLKINSLSGIEGSIIVGHDGNIMASQLVLEDYKKMTMGVLAMGLLGNSSNICQKLDLGKLQQIILSSKNDSIVLFNMAIGILGIVCDNSKGVLNDIFKEVSQLINID